MEQNYINYYNGFINAAVKKVKPQFGIAMAIFPFLEGAVIKIEMKQGALHKIEKKSQSESLCDALVNTSLVSREKCSKIFGKSVGKTIVAVTSPTVYLIIKNSNETEWTASSALHDLERIITLVKERYGKKQEGDYRS